MIALNSRGHIFLGTQGQGLLRSTDNGATWLSISSGISDGEVRDVAIGPGGIIYAGTFTAGMFRSTDDGGTWISINAGLPEKDIASITVTNTGRVLVGIKKSNGVYKSDDNGNSWTLTGMPRTSRVDNFIVKGDGALFADANEPSDGIYRSTDNGDSWRRIGFAGKTIGIHPQSVDAKGNIYVGDRTGGHIYRSSDNGDSWQEYDSGIMGIPIGALVSPTGYGYAASSSGFFRSTSVLTSVRQSRKDSDRGFTLEQNYPNPITSHTADGNSTSISFSLDRPAHAVLKLYDLNANVLAVLVNEHKLAGTHTITFDVSFLRSGYYFYRLETEIFAKTMRMQVAR